MNKKIYGLVLQQHKFDGYRIIQKALIHVVGVLIFFASFSTAMAEVSPETVVDIFQRLENLEKKTRELHGKNEELQHQITQLKKQQKQGFLAVDERIDALKSSDVSSTVEKAESSKKEEPRVKIIEKKPEVSIKPTKKAQKVVADTAVEKSSPAKVTPAVEKSKTKKIAEEAASQTTKAAPKKRRAPSAYEKETYQAAFNLMKTSPSAATRAFKEYIKMQPTSPLAANSQYWIGEIMYSHNNYKGAVQEFIKVLQNYKYSDKAPDAAIKLGYSFYALKNWAYARRTFEDVLRYFPNNKNAVNLAKKRLETMKAAGH